MRLKEKVIQIISKAQFHKITQHTLDNSTSRIYAFYNNEYVTDLTGFDFSKCSNLKMIFMGCVNLESVDFSNRKEDVGFDSSSFKNCTAIKHIRFYPNTIIDLLSIPSGDLTDESIQSIVDGLHAGTYESTLTLHSDVFDRLTEEQLNVIEAKNWAVQ